VEVSIPLVTMTVPAPASATDERTVLSLRCRLYRFDAEEKEWKERGTGQLRFLQHNTSRKIRIVMHRDSVNKLCANFYVMDGMITHAFQDKGTMAVYGPAPRHEEEASVPPINEVFMTRFKLESECTEYIKFFTKARETNVAIRSNKEADLLPEIEDTVVDPEPRTPNKRSGSPSSSPSPSRATVKSPFKEMEIPKFGSLSLTDKAAEAKKPAKAEAVPAGVESAH